LGLSSTTPVPCETPEDPIWPGTTVELLTADAVATCVGGDVQDLQITDDQIGVRSDYYLRGVIDHMPTTMSEAATNGWTPPMGFGTKFDKWRAYRGDEDENCDLSTEQHREICSPEAEARASRTRRRLCLPGRTRSGAMGRGLSG
jgi:hypothetical protein